jgi:mersacidin/lichenicidin family type 2 lantibiotic
MSRLDVVRAWKDEEYRGRLTESEAASLPENPAGSVDIGQLGSGAGAGVLGVVTSCGQPCSCGLNCQSQFWQICTIDVVSCFTTGPILQ